MESNGEETQNGENGENKENADEETGGSAEVGGDIGSPEPATLPSDAERESNDDSDDSSDEESSESDNEEESGDSDDSDGDEAENADETCPRLQLHADAETSAGSERTLVLDLVPGCEDAGARLGHRDR